MAGNARDYAHGPWNGYTAIEALKMGAFDFLSKGCDNDEVVKIVVKAVDPTMRLAEPRFRPVLTTI